jgi:hypothetical protein
MILRNIAAIRISLFDGFFEIDILDSFRAGVNVYFFRINLAELTVSFNFAASYKNPALVDALHQQAIIATPYLDAVGSVVTKVVQTIQEVANACNQFLSTPIAISNGLNNLVIRAQSLLVWLNNVTSWARNIQPRVDALAASSPSTTGAASVRDSLTPVVSTVTSSSQVDTQMDTVSVSARSASGAFNDSLPVLTTFSSGFAAASPIASQGVTGATANNLGSLQTTATSVDTYYNAVSRFNNSAVWADPNNAQAPLGTLSTSNARTNSSLSLFPPAERATVSNSLRGILDTTYPTDTSPASITALQTLRSQLIVLQQGLIRYGPIFTSLTSYASSLPAVINFVRTALPLEAISTIQPAVQSFVTGVSPSLLTTLNAVQAEITNLRNVMDTFTNSIDAAVNTMSQRTTALLQNIASAAGIPSLIRTLQSATKGLLSSLGATTMEDLARHMGVLDNFGNLRDPFQQLQSFLTDEALSIAQNFCNTVAGFVTNTLSAGIDNLKSYLKLVVEFSLSLPASMGVPLEALHDVSDDASDAIDKLGDLAENEMDKYATEFCTDLTAVRTFLASVMSVLNGFTATATAQIRQDVQYLYNNTARFVLPALDWDSLTKELGASVNRTFDELVSSTLRPFRTQVQTLRGTFTRVSNTIDNVKVFLQRLDASRPELSLLRSRVPAISSFVSSLTNAKATVDAAAASIQGASAARVQTYLRFIDRSVKGIDSIVALYGAGSTSNASCVPGAPCTATFMLQLIRAEAANFRTLWTSLSTLRLNDTSLSGLQATFQGLAAQTTAVVSGANSIKVAYPQFAAAVAAVANVRAIDQVVSRRRRDLGHADEPAHVRVRRAAAAAGCGVTTNISFAMGFADMLANTCTMAQSSRNAVTKSQSSLNSLLSTIGNLEGKAGQFSGALSFLKNAVLAAQSPLRVAGTSLDSFIGAFGPIASFLQLDFSKIFNLVKYSSFATSFFNVLDPVRSVVDSVRTKTQGLVDTLNAARRALISVESPSCPDFTAVRGCSASLCLCRMPRTDNYAKDLIFPLKYAHLFSQAYQAGGFMGVIPGLYNDFTPRGIIPLDGHTLIR